MLTELLKHDLGTLFEVYAYNHALELVSHKDISFNEDFLVLLRMMKCRTKLDITPLFEEGKAEHFKEKYHFRLYHNDYEEELIANYIMVLEVQLRIGDSIDFVRAVSPIIYRLFFRLVKQKIPNIEDYLFNAKDDRYDTWYLGEMLKSKSFVLRKYASLTNDARVTSKSLQDILSHCDLPYEIREVIEDLRRFEKSVRNPLAHLIKPFDEAKLFSTTRYSSQDFLEKIIDLAIYTGVKYNKQIFYFDRANELLLKLL